ncbi:uncharacterized protein LOC132745551 [Ruditapes philippinarum]|uniref:uncharacterized protein LOC132745551 n=1 Tax=Ruditapes philippinarum TaxID=129788 RepID=UPI00295BFE42|nr:uncharacterized protein LOC132745551 [Ruditapes philippinarum]
MMTSSALCKSMRYIHYVVNNSSGLLLLVISVERYRKICHPFKTQLTARQTLYLCYGTIFFSAFIAIPAGVLYGASTIETGVENVTGRQCYVDDDLDQKVLFEIYQSVLMAESVISIVIFLVLYAFIIRKLWISDQFIQAMRNMQIRSASNTSHETSFSTDCDRDGDGIDSSYTSNPTSLTGSKDTQAPFVKNGNNLRTMLESDVTNKSSSSQSLNTGNGVNEKRPRGKEKSLWRMSRELFKRGDNSNRKPRLARAASDTRLNKVKDTRMQNTNKFSTLTPAERLVMGKMLEGKKQSLEKQKTSRPKHMKTTARVTLMLFTVSMVFVVSFIPHLALMIATVEKEGFLENMNEGEMMAYQVFLRSFILNNVANPIIYLFCESKFRHESRELFRKCFLCRSNKG